MLQPAVFQLELLKQNETLFSGLVQRVVLPGVEGILELLPHHMPFMCFLTKGDVHVHTDQQETYPIEGGTVYFLNNQCQILAQNTSSSG
jgi:F0F1-type ATP synthase epsilon subunit